MNSSQYRLSIFATLLLIGLIGGCSTQANTIAQDNEMSGKDQTIQSRIAQLKANNPPALSPAVINLGIDQSGSMNQDARVHSLTWKELEPVLVQLQKTGGTFAMSAICDRSNRPLARVTFDVQPRLSPEQLTLETLPEAPDLSQGNPIKNRQKFEEYQKQVTELEQKVVALETDWQNYERQQKALQQTNQQKLDAIKPKLQEILEHPRNCQSTDIQNAVSRAQTLFNEPTTWEQKPRKLAVFVTDGLDSFSDSPVDLQADQIILVNGAIEMGIFENLPHQRFESPQSAMQALTNQLAL